MSEVTAPAPPAAGVAPDADTLRRYLEELGRWRTARRAELDVLDERALRAADSDTYTGDLALSLSLWQAVSKRCDELLVVWDSGRVGRGERERLARLIHGRLDAGLGAGLAISLVEACRLCDSMTGTLRARLSLDPATEEISRRLATIRAALERCREDLEHPGPDADKAATAAGRVKVERYAARVTELVASAGRGGDVTGSLGALEGEVARFERDLIVAAATLRSLVLDRARAGQLLAELEPRIADLRSLATRCRSQVTPPPRLAVPDLRALGPIPDGPGVREYLDRLTRVRSAVELAAQAYTRPLAELDELDGRLTGYRAMAAARGRAGVPAVAAAYQAARVALDTRPCHLAEATRLVDGYAALARGAAPGPAPGAGGTTRPWMTQTGSSVEGRTP